MLFLLTCLPSGWAAAPTNAPAPSGGALASKSVFIDDPKFGKDPFFPKSTRRDPSANSDTQSGGASGLPASLVLKDLSGPPNHRLALINNRTIGAGETIEIKVDGQLMKLHCLEIRERSVIIRCNNQPPKELFLRNL